MTMNYLVNVPHIETDKGLEFYSPFEHVSVDWPQIGQPLYMVWSHSFHMDVAGADSFAKAMDIATEFLKYAETANA